MLIRPQSRPWRGAAAPFPLSHCFCLRAPVSFGLLPYLAGAAAPTFQRRRFKINISLHVLLITTNLNLPSFFSLPDCQPVFFFAHSLSSLALSTGNECTMNYFDPLSVEQADPRHSGMAGVSAEDELELSTPFSVIIVLLGSLK